MIACFFNIIVTHIVCKHFLQYLSIAILKTLHHVSFGVNGHGQLTDQLAICQPVY